MEHPSPEQFNKFLSQVLDLHNQPTPTSVLPSPSTITTARSKLHSHLPGTGLGLQNTFSHLQELTPGLNASSRSSNYYGFVTGGTTPVALLADHLVTHYDQNVSVHLPNETLATDIEDRALCLLAELLDLEPTQWPHRTFTTGATASNVLGLACAREFVIREYAARRGGERPSVGELGIVSAMREAGLHDIQILSTVPHSSLCKAAGVLGIGRASVKNMGTATAGHRFDMKQLEEHLKMPNVASIVAVSASEVNTGLYATSGASEMQDLRALCDKYGAWMHVDGAFGILGRLLTNTEKYSTILQNCAGLELADSITGDGHKLLNVPYDCGFFFSKHLDIADNVFLNPNAAYLATGNDANAIPSPLNIGLENSRRFRAFPVYANLVAYGKDGYRDMLERQIDLSRGIARFIMESEEYELLPESNGSVDEVLNSIYIIVLFRAKDDNLNKELVSKIKATRLIYVSGTSWAGRPACRFAVSNWMADASKNLPLVKQILQDIAAE